MAGAPACCRLKRFEGLSRDYAGALPYPGSLPSMGNAYAQ